MSSGTLWDLALVGPPFSFLSSADPPVALAALCASCFALRSAFSSAFDLPPPSAVAAAAAAAGAIAAAPDCASCLGLK